MDDLHNFTNRMDDLHRYTLFLHPVGHMLSDSVRERFEFRDFESPWNELLIRQTIPKPFIYVIDHVTGDWSGQSLVERTLVEYIQKELLTIKGFYVKG